MKALAPLLRLCGIDPVRYGLLLGLFARISERREMLGQLGRDGFTLKAAALLYAVLTALLGVLMVIIQPPLATYAGAFLALSGFLLFTILLTETSNSLVNPTEALVLAHQPIDGATYTAAKLTHLLRVVLYLAPGLSIVPAFLALLLPDCPFYYPLLHLAGALAVGLFIALACCSLFGWLLRLAPPARVKSLGQTVEAVPLLLLACLQFTIRPLLRLVRGFSLPQDPAWRTALIAAAIVLALAAGISGIRALSADYLVRVSAMVQGGDTARRRRRSWLGACAARLDRRPSARAGFHYVSAMMARDWQFRRQLIPVLPMVVIPFVQLRHISYSSVFDPAFTPLHLVPHALGALLFFVCTVLAYGSDHKGTWIFQLAPAGSVPGFARGLHAALWLRVIVVPLLALFAVTAWTWGPADAALFAAYSGALASCYLAVELRLVEGLPFSRQPETSRSPFLFPVMLGGGLVMGAVVAVQYFALFRSRVVTAAATLALAGAAWLLTRSALRTLAESLRFHLSTLSEESGTLYHEIDN